MSNIYDKQIEEMQRLINYGVNENNTNNNDSQSVVEYHAKGADGKTYGIIRECNKFYIKVAPKKDTEVLAEDYDYIGGINNKKENEFSTYTMASKQFGLKMKCLNEAYNKKDSVMITKPQETAEWQINETKEMRNEINRYNQIVNNVNSIINEGYITENNGGDPFENQIQEKNGNIKNPVLTVDGKEDPSKGANNNESAPYDEKSKKCGEDAPFCDKVKGEEGDNQSTNISGKFKPVVGESKNRTFRLTEEQVLAWSKSKDFMDMSNGTQIGSSSPFKKEAEDPYNAPTEPIHEETVVHNTDNQNVPESGTSHYGDTDPYIDNVNEEDAKANVNPNFTKMSEPNMAQETSHPAIGQSGDSMYETVMPEELAGAPEDRDLGIEVIPDEEEPDAEIKTLYNDNEGFEEEPENNDVTNDIAATRAARSGEGMRGLENYLDTWNKFDDEDEFYESRKRRGRRVNETKLNVFGKHPAYRKVPFSTPANREIDRYGRDWNDDSAKGEQPFGKQIGSSAPFTEEVVEMLTDAIVNKLSKKKV